MLHWLAGWWDGVELWIVGLPYPVSATLVLAVLLPSFWVGAWLIDRVVDAVSARLTRVRAAEPPVRSAEKSSGPTS